MSNDSLAPVYFEQVYAAHPDPWNFETSEYERSKYATTLAALPRERYARGFEIGCSIGVLTLQLARQCARLLAVDVNADALDRARRRCLAESHVEFALMQVPESLPERSFDLIVVSEVAYYWSAADLRRASTWMLDHLERCGTLLLVHWTPPVADYPLSGDQVHEHFLSLAEAGHVRHLHGERHAQYRLDSFSAT